MKFYYFTDQSDFDCFDSTFYTQILYLPNDETPLDAYTLSLYISPGVKFEMVIVVSDVSWDGLNVTEVAHDGQLDSSISTL